MARKGNLNINIEVSNILEEIVKNGKIPVIRVSNKGFQNYKQTSYFDRYSHNSNIMYAPCHKSRKEILNNEKPEKGCFVILGGVCGTDVVGVHENEDVHIGYIEPTTKVFATYTYKGFNYSPFSYVTAKERFESVKGLFENIKNEDLELSRLDLYSEAIVDSKDIKKVCVVNAFDEKVFINNLKENNFLNIFPKKEIIDRIIYSPKEVDKTLLELVGKDKNIKVSFMNNWCYEVDFYERIYFDKVYENLVFKVLKDFIVFSKSSNIANEYLKDLENFDKTLTNNKYVKINNLRYDPIKESFHIEFRISYPFGRKPNKKFESFNGVFSINISSNDISLNYTKKDYFKDEEIKTNLSFFDIMDNNSRFYFIEFFKEFLRYFDMLKKYTNIKETNIIKSIKAFVKIEEDLKDYGLSLDVKNYTYCVEITNNLKIEYNFLLNDFVVEFYNNFYNIENFNIDNDLETLVKKFENIFLEDFKDAKLSLASFFM